MGVHHECCWSVRGIWCILEIPILGLQERRRGISDSLHDSDVNIRHAPTLSVDIRWANA